MKAAGLFALLLLACATPAWAATDLDMRSVAANTDVTLTVSASVEELNAYNEKVTVEVPDGFRVLSCPQAGDFSCSQRKATSPARTIVTWQRAAPGQPVPFTTDHFPFRLHTIDHAGAYVFALTQVYSNGKADHARPMLQVTASAAPTTTTTAAPRIAVRAAVPWAAAVTPHRVPTHVPVTEPAWFADNDGEADPEMAVHELGSEHTTHTTQLLVEGAFASLAAGAVYWFRRRVVATS